VFGSLYSLQRQGGGSRTTASGTTRSAPIWQGIFNRDGHHFHSVICNVQVTDFFSR
jgi:hypothetical protein